MPLGVCALRASLFVGSRRRFGVCYEFNMKKK
jgi:hypothetical protein